MTDIVDQLRGHPGLNDSVTVQFRTMVTQRHQAADEIERLRDRSDELIEAFQRIDSWSQAYPLDVFPEPDLKKARELLTAGGITLDAISAHCMRHVVEGVGKIARAALHIQTSGERE